MNGNTSIKLNLLGLMKNSVNKTPIIIPKRKSQNNIC